METQTLLALATFAAVNSITPGPNNLMLLASGVRHGFRASVPHMLGISLGFAVLMMAAGLGLGALFERWPALHQVLRWAGISYLLWLAWQLWHADAPRTAATGSAAAPMSFLGAALFQWVNPKAWMMAIGAVAGFMAADGGVGAALLISLVCAAVNLPCISVWVLGGVRLSRWLSEPVARRRFNASMAALLLASVYPMLGA
jgi:threonine/homoserine/homoserine lactone efflux protein